MVPTFDGVHGEAVLILSCPTIWDIQALCVVSFVFFDWVDGYTILKCLWFYLPFTLAKCDKSVGW
jgi:ABC-type transport system involved in Fe-S cluster assembly fused permease/ATPase subunit